VLIIASIMKPSPTTSAPIPVVTSAVLNNLRAPVVSAILPAVTVNVALRIVAAALTNQWQL
jgi:hypothetical protein